MAAANRTSSWLVTQACKGSGFPSHFPAYSNNKSILLFAQTLRLYLLQKHTLSHRDTPYKRLVTLTELKLSSAIGKVSV